MSISPAKPEVSTFDQVIERAKEHSKVKTPTAALVMPVGRESLEPFLRAAADGLIKAVVVADEKSLKKGTGGVSTESDRFEIVSVADENAAVRKALELAAENRIQMIAQGGTAPSVLLENLFSMHDQFLIRGQTVSHVAVMKPALYSRLLILSDGVVTVEPDLAAKIKIIGNMAKVSSRIGLHNPRIAVVGAVEAVYPQMQATVDGALLAKMCERGQIKGAVVDGPLSFDVAVDMFAAKAKGVTSSEVAGQADGLLASNIEVANGIYNAMSLYGNCDIGGVVVGGAVPVAVNSAADSEASRYNSIVLASLCC